MANIKREGLNSESENQVVAANFNLLFPNIEYSSLQIISTPEKILVDQTKYAQLTKNIENRCIRNMAFVFRDQPVQKCRTMFAYRLVKTHIDFSHNNLDLEKFEKELKEGERLSGGYASEMFNFNGLVYSVIKAGVVDENAEPVAFILARYKTRNPLFTAQLPSSSTRPFAA